MTRTGTTQTGAGRDDAAGAVLQNVTSSAARLRRARTSYRASLVAAVTLLEQEGAPDPFARVAGAAGISRQAVRELYARYRDEHPAG